jgi:hypothetical protein
MKIRLLHIGKPTPYFLFLLPIFEAGFSPGVLGRRLAAIDVQAGVDMGPPGKPLRSAGLV